MTGFTPFVRIHSLNTAGDFMSILNGAAPMSPALKVILMICVIASFSGCSPPQQSSTSAASSPGAVPAASDHSNDCNYPGTVDEWKHIVEGYEKPDQAPPAREWLASARTRLSCNPPSSPQFAQAQALIARLDTIEKTLPQRELAYRPSNHGTAATAAKESQWSYDHRDDDMAKGVIREASIISSNVLDFSFPYGGPQHARFYLRSHPRFGKNAILRIEKGQLLCPSYDGCSVLVRFDDEQARSFSASGSSDHSTETLFINGYPQFLAKLPKTKRLRVSATVYQEGTPTMDFDVSGFDPKQYAQEK
jgi:hypothetical protein